MKTTNKSTVEYRRHMGDDLTIVDAARVSFDKESVLEEDGYETIWITETVTEQRKKYKLSNQDEKLINYLAKHNHWSPFAHTSIQLRINAPLFVARQLVKHQVGGVWNEVSRRYVDEEPTFYFPDKWRGKPVNAKQGSTGFVKAPYCSDGIQEFTAEKVTEACLWLYESSIANGVAPEQARMILPQNMMTTWYWTGSLMFFHRVFKQRAEAHAQLETQEVAIQIGDICNNLFPVSWKSLNGI